LGNALIMSLKKSLKWSWPNLGYRPDTPGRTEERRDEPNEDSADRGTNLPHLNRS
jgi:hypothetical protein